MRRITLTIVTTLAILVLLFSYRTSRNEPITASTVAIGSAHVVTAPVISTQDEPDPAPSTENAITVPTTMASTVPTTASTSSSRSRSTTSVQSTPTSKPAAPKTTAATTATTTSRTALSATVDGAAVSTRYGDVQVEVRITDGKITDVNAIEYPNQEFRDQQINADALPQLRSQVLAAQSANIAGVSGATYTTQGYIGSLQSALDQVHFQ